MALQVAACPRCKGALVFGERACRSCGQTFQYGQSPPPQPTFAQIIEALQAAGLPLPPGAVPTPATRADRPNPFDMAIESGRFKSVGEVPVEDIPGLIDSSLFKRFTPDHVDAQPVFGLDSGRFAEVGDVRGGAPGLEVTGLEATGRDAVGDVFAQPVSGIFHSDIFRVDAEVSTLPVDGFEPSPSATRPPPRASRPEAPAAKRNKRADLGTVMCRCGERHHEPRCPSCGTSHPDAP